MSVRTKFILIIVLTVLTAIIALPGEDRFLRFLGIRNTNLQIQQGLDLQGGAHYLFQADTSKYTGANKSDAINSLIDVGNRS
jgi:preprotein translocase subunit SecD